MRADAGDLLDGEELGEERQSPRLLRLGCS
jgi:hypothetical protein